MKTKIVNLSEILKNPKLSLNPKDYMKTKKNRDDVEHYQSRLISRITDYLKDNNIGIMNFNEDFAIYVEKSSFDDEYLMQGVIASALDSDGNIYTTEGNVRLSSISVYELAYILDLIESNLFEIESNISDNE